MTASDLERLARERGGPVVGVNLAALRQPQAVPVALGDDFRVGALTLVVPVRLVSEANRASHEHWRVRDARAKSQRSTVAAAVARPGPAVVRPFLRPPYHVTFTRVGGRRLDPDNLAGAFKHVQDALCAWLGVDDGDYERVTFTYAQQPGKPPYFVLVRIEGGE